jgi:hypothetical protein
MNPIVDDKLLSSLLPVVFFIAATGMVSWKLFELVKDQIEQQKNVEVLKTVGTVCSGVLIVCATVSIVVWMDKHWIRPEGAKPEPPKQAEPQTITVLPTPEPPKSSRPDSAYRRRIRPSRQQAQPLASETAQTSNAPLTPQTSQSSSAAPPAQSQSPQAPVTEARPLFAPAQSCPVTPAPATIIIPPGEKGPEQDQLV